MSKPSEDGRSPHVETLLQNFTDELDRGSLPLEVYTNEELYEKELHNIFGSAWVFIGHESELPEEGDYALRFIGEDPFIFVRDESGEIQVLFDSCRHRGAKLCRSDQGNTSHFRCPYHGWTFKTNGDLIGVPNFRESYEGMDKDEWSLVSASRIETYGGLVFASIAEDGPSLREYLGDYTWYLDILMNFTEGGMEVVGEPTRYTVDSNWKIGAENFSGDGYHTQIVHKSVIETGFMDKDWSWEGTRYYEYISGIDGALDSSILIGQLELEERNAFWAYPDEVLEAMEASALSDEQKRVARNSTVHVTNIFPNVSLIMETASSTPDREQKGYLNIRKWQPAGPGKCDVWNWVLLPKESPEAYKEEAYEAATATFGPSGNFEQDDHAVWEGVTESSESTVAQKHNLGLNYTAGLEGIGNAELDEEWPGPGDAYRTHNDGFARTFYRNWHHCLTNGGA